MSFVYNYVFQIVSASINDRINSLSGSSGDTGSLLLTASFSNPNLTFTKGDGSIFPIDLSTLVPTSSSFALSSSFASTASFALSSSFASTASFALNGGVQKIVAGTNITVSPASGVGIVTISSFGSGSTINNLSPRFILSDSEYIISEGSQTEVYDLYNYGTLTLQPGTVILPLGTSSITNDPLLTIEKVFYNAGVVNNGGIIQYLI
jgi:hypothetical protein